MKDKIKKLPILGNLAIQLYINVMGAREISSPFPGSNKYWEERYAAGGNSGVGSYGKFAEFKAEVINTFVTSHDVESVVEFGCGDGNQLEFANYRRYLGLDVSETAISIYKEKFATHTNKSFKLMQEYEGEIGDLALSLDVIYHLVEDKVFENYMWTLFNAARRYVIIYSSNPREKRGYGSAHVKHRQFTKWIEDNMFDWENIGHIPNKYPFEGDYLKGSLADFFIYERKIEHKEAPSSAP